MSLSPQLSRRSLLRNPVLLLAHAAILIAGIVAISTLPVTVASPYRIGHRSPDTVVVRKPFSYINQTATQRERQQAAEAVPTIYRDNVAQAKASRSAAETLIDDIIGVLEGPSSGAQHQKSIQQLLIQASVPDNQLPKLGLKKWRLVRAEVAHLLTESIQVLKPFSGSGVQRAIQVLGSSLPNPNGDVAQITDDFVRTFIKPTLVMNRSATQRKRSAARAKVPPVVVHVGVGTVIVHRGAVITAPVYQELKALGLPSTPSSWTSQLGAGLFGVALIGLTMWYLRSFYPSVTESLSLMLLLDASVLAAAFVGRVAIPGHPLLAYFIPLAGISAIVGVLISSEVGVAMSVMMALLVGWLGGAGFEIVVYYLLTGVGGAMAVRQLRRLNDFLTIGASITAVALLVVAAFRLSGPDNWTLIFMRDNGAGAIINGLISSALAFGAFVVLGSTFGVATSLHLLELGHPDQPLLRRLMADAPGTYNHSLVVASMIERAAQETGSNVLLARVMALYHDVGKIANPLCFIENQIGTANIHDDLMPQESAEIIRAHVSHGAALARQHRLPVPIRDAILQHHGTMTMAFFFHKALQEDPNADAEVYSYPGPRPQTKEIALLMLADGCEGAVRAMPSKTPEAMRDTVNSIIDERVATGQLSRCDLSLRDLATARLAFVDVLSGIYHPRVEYPAATPRAATS